ncbi:MAG: MATE family efflux transporter [Bacteroidales bacterium]|jgi:putative MATE family efflux protein|nr:MATE family efflux transporter [Bacteroidales bacterium]
MSSKNFLSSHIKSFKIENLKLLWKNIQEAISGTDKDFTKEKLSTAILLLAIPMVLEMIMESIFAVADIFFVSKLGPDAIATVGITESLLTIVYSIGMGLSMATTAIVSRRIGEKKPYRASVAAVQSIIVASLVSLIIGIPGMFFAKDLLKIMGANADIIREGSSYPAILLGSNIIIMLLFIINAVFRSSGDAATSMKVLLLANGINILLDPLFIFGLGPIPAMGIKGAAIATTTGRGIAVIYQFYLLFKGNGRIKIYKKAIQLNVKVMSNLIKISLGGIGQSIIATSSWIGMVRIIAIFGSTALAGYTIAIRIIIFVLLPSWGISNAAATLVGQNLGANKPDRAEKAVWATGYVNMILLGIVSIVFIIEPHFFIRLFIDNKDVVNTGAQGLRIVSLGFVFYAMGMVMIQAFNGAGDTRTPTIINVFCFWIIEIPLAYYLANYFNDMNESGVYTAIIIAESIMALIAMWLFKKGKWKLQKI